MARDPSTDAGEWGSLLARLHGSATRRGNEGAQSAFDQAETDLRAPDTDDSRFFAYQLVSVLNVLCEAPTD